MPVIQCPACSTGSIDINPQFLIMGAMSECTHCQAKIGVAQESKALLSDKLEEYKQYQQKINHIQKEGNTPNMV